MRLFGALTVAVLLAVCVHAQPSALNGDEKALVADALKPLAAFETKEEAATQQLTQAYIQHLDTLIEAAKKRSAFDDALKIKTEKNAMSAGTSVAMDFKDETLPLSLRKARYDYEKRLGDMHGKAAPHKIKAIQESIDLLKIVHEKAGRADRFEAALEVKKMAANYARQITDLRPKEPEAPKAVTRLEIEVLVDGFSEVRVTKEGLTLVSKGVTKPGRHGSRNEPTYVNGVAWTPVWGKNDEDVGVDETELYELEMNPPGTSPAGMEWTFKLLAVGLKRGGDAIVDRDAVSTSATRKAFTVSIPDTQGGSMWYRFELTR